MVYQRAQSGRIKHEFVVISPGLPNAAAAHAEAIKILHALLSNPQTSARALFADRVRQALLGCARDGGQALMIVDLDGFKQTNDVYGHAAGDRVLREVASAMRDCVRVSDTVARLGGDEFGVLLVPAESGETLAATADRLRRHVGRGEVSCSIGLALGTAQDSLDALTADADRALYQAKREGRNRCVIAASAREAVR